MQYNNLNNQAMEVIPQQSHMVHAHSAGIVRVGVLPNNSTP